ncbi:unnamed protein product [Lota lota]
MCISSLPPIESAVRVTWLVQPSILEEEATEPGVKGRSGVVFVESAPTAPEPAAAPPQAHHAHRQRHGHAAVRRLPGRGVRPSWPSATCPPPAWPDHFERVAERIHGNRTGGTLVHCVAGMSRLAGAGHGVPDALPRGHALRRAHAWVRESRPCVRLNAGFWEQLLRYERRLYGGEHDLPDSLYNLEPPATTPPVGDQRYRPLPEECPEFAALYQRGRGPRVPSAYESSAVLDDVLHQLAGVSAAELCTSSSRSQHPGHRGDASPLRHFVLAKRTVNGIFEQLLLYAKEASAFAEGLTSTLVK